MKEYNGTSYENQYKAKFHNKGYVPAFKRKQESDVEVVQESLLEGLPETKVERRRTGKPLTGKQRRAMKKSLSVIMEQEQHERQLPYVHRKTVVEKRGENG